VIFPTAIEVVGRLPRPPEVPKALPMIRILAWASVAATVALAPFFLLMAGITLAALASKIGRAGRRPATSGPRARFLIVIPAHDEEGVIAATVRSCFELDHDPSRFTVHVIADNCGDATAALAREAGADVTERSTPDLRSKGHALEYFFERVSRARPDSDEYDAAVLIDADTVVDPSLLRAFERGLAAGQDWIQGYYTVRNPDASWRTRLMTFAFSLANGVWPLGLDRSGLSVGLKGNGMCFSAQGLRRHPWKAHGLVEDMEFALSLRVAGERVHFDPNARVYGEMVSRGGAGAASQRRRWEDGRKSLRGKFRSPLARSRRLGIVPKLCYLTDLYFPPLASLGLALLITASIHPLARAIPDSRSIADRLLIPHGAMAASLLAYALSPVLVMGLPPRYLRDLAVAPYYVAWKLIVGLGRRQKGWIRTPREPQPRV